MLIALGLVQVSALSPDSAVSVALMVVIIGAVAWLSRALTRSEEQLKGINEKLGDLKDIPERMVKVEGQVANMVIHMSLMEGDLNNFWQALRKEEGGDDIDNTRRERGTIRKGRKPKQE